MRLILTEHRKDNIQLLPARLAGFVHWSGESIFADLACNAKNLWDGY
jgi:hypothetical protein